MIIIVMRMITIMIMIMMMKTTTGVVAMTTLNQVFVSGIDCKKAGSANRHQVCAKQVSTLQTGLFSASCKKYAEL